MLMASCGPPEPTAPAVPEPPAAPVPGQQSWDAWFDVTESGQPRVRIEAPYMAEYENEDSTYTILGSHPDSLQRRVTAHIFDETGTQSATVTANVLYHYDRENRFEAEGNVVVEARGDKRLETEFLIWYEDERTIRTPRFVRITTPTERMQGYNLVADEDLETYSLSRVTGQVTLEDD